MEDRIEVLESLHLVWRKCHHSVRSNDRLRTVTSGVDKISPHNSGRPNHSLRTKAYVEEMSPYHFIKSNYDL